MTADQALGAEESVLPRRADGTWFVNLNCVSPGTKQGISNVVEAAAGLKPAPQKLGFTGMKVVSEALAVASATKMSRSVIVNGMEALVTESLCGMLDAIRAQISYPQVERER